MPTPRSRNEQSHAPLRLEPSPADIDHPTSFSPSSRASDYVELLIRQTLTPQGKSLTGRPVFHIIVQGTYNRLCGIQHNRFDGRGLETERISVTAPAPDPTNLSLPGGSEVIDQPPQLWRSSWRRWRAPSDLEEPGLPPLITEGPLVIWPTHLQPLGHPLNGREGTDVGGEAPDQRLATEPLTLM